MMKQKLEISSLIDSYKDFLIYEKGLSENTVSAYISDINKVSGQEEYFDLENFLVINLIINIIEKIIKAHNNIL